MSLLRHYYVANTTEEAKKNWPPLINAFVRKLAKNAGMDVGKVGADVQQVDCVCA